MRGEAANTAKLLKVSAKIKDAIYTSTSIELMTGRFSNS
jgi:hypothetical protein